MALETRPVAVPRPAFEIVGRLREGGPALVALSGGVDSAVVAALAWEALGPHAGAAMVTGPSVAPGEVERARAVASSIGIPLALLPADQLADEAYRQNSSDRCYRCRVVETSRLGEEGRRRGVRQYLDGLQLDDLLEVRPGRRAMEEAGFWHPLAWASWDKARVRAEALRRGLPNWDAPSESCLASRVPHGQPISAELLRRIGVAEAAVRAFGFRRVRVRAQGSGARIEVDPDEVPRLLAAPLAAEVTAAVLRAGFDPVSLDPAGYHGGRPLPVVR